MTTLPKYLLSTLDEIFSIITVEDYPYPTSIFAEDSPPFDKLLWARIIGLRNYFVGFVAFDNPLVR